MSEQEKGVEGVEEILDIEVSYSCKQTGQKATLKMQVLGDEGEESVTVLFNPTFDPPISEDTKDPENILLAIANVLTAKAHAIARKAGGKLGG